MKTFLGLLLTAVLALACTAPSGGASGAPDPSVAPDASAAPSAPPKDDYGY